MKIVFPNGAAVANLEILRAVATANIRRPRGERSVEVDTGLGAFDFNFEGVTEEHITGVFEDPDTGPIFGRIPLEDIKSITIGE